jgi:hypothetical protein
MPLPERDAGESQDEFIGRCMGALKDEFPDRKQRLAVCFRQWRGDRKESANVPDVIHSDNVLPGEPPWRDVDLAALPAEAFAFTHRQDDRNTWAMAHHWVDSSGVMHLHTAGLAEAWQNAIGAFGPHSAAPIVAHLAAHREALGLESDPQARYMPSAWVIPNATDPKQPLPEWVELVCTGYWLGHPSGKEMLITPSHLQSAHDYYQRHFAANDTHMTVDYEHASAKEGDGGPNAISAGWIVAMELRAEGNEL